MMRWVDQCLQEVLSGREVQLIIKGRSLEPYVLDGACVHISPISFDYNDISEGDIVLARLPSGRIIVHMVIEPPRDNHFCIGNSSGRVDGWVDRHSVLGKAVAAEFNSNFAGITVKENYL